VMKDKSSHSRTDHGPALGARRGVALWLAAALLCLVLAQAAAAHWARNLEAYNMGNLVRLRVVAHSDTERDQAIKLAVRDAVLDCAGPHLEGASDAAGARARLTVRLPDIERAAAAEVARAGADYPVRVDLTQVWFPATRYETPRGELRMPSGRYEALQVVLGEGRGHNWWCVLFPTLCLEPAGGPTAAEAGAVDAGAPGDGPSPLPSLPGESGPALRLALLELARATGQELGEVLEAVARVAGRQDDHGPLSWRPLDW